MACQLDHLCELPTDRARRKALTELPPTLPATYERILQRLDNHGQGVRDLVRKVLLVVSLASDYFDLPQTCEAVSVPDDAETFDEDERVDDFEILKWCSSLVRRSTRGHLIEFAHFTVQEFLEGFCLQHETLSFYHVSRHKAYSFLAPVCLRYLSFTNHERSSEATVKELQRISETIRTRPFYTHAALRWPIYASANMEKEPIRQLWVRLFDLRKTAIFTSWTLQILHDHLYMGPEFQEVTLEHISSILRPDFTPLHMAALLCLPNVCRYLLDHGAKVNQQSRFGTPLHCAVGGFSVFYTDGPRTNLGFLLHGTRPSDRSRTTQILIAKGANLTIHLNTPFLQQSLLQLAFKSEDLHLVAKLLHAGVPVEDADLQCLYRILSSSKSHYRDQEDLDAWLSMLETLGPDKDNQNPRARLFWEISKAMKRYKISLANLPIPGEDHSLIPNHDANEATIHAFLRSVIHNNDVAAVEKFLAGNHRNIVDSMTFNEVDDKGEDSETMTALHLACVFQATDVLELLLDYGCPHDRTTTKGRTPLHLCCHDKDEECAKVLLRHGASIIAQNDELETIWHLAAGENSYRILQTLASSDQPIDAALRMISKKQQTPIGAALDATHSDAAFLLADLCPTVEYWAARRPLFELAAKFRSSTIVQRLLDVGVPLDTVYPGRNNPLHYIHLRSSLATVKLLVETFPHGLNSRNANGQTPFEWFITRVLDDGLVRVGPDFYKPLLSGCDIFEPKTAAALWGFLCERLSICIIDGSKRGDDLIPEMVSHLTNIGIVTAYEDSNHRSSLLPLAEQLDICYSTKCPRTTDLRSWTLRTKRYHWCGTLNCRKWDHASQILSEVMSATRYWESAATEPSMTKLLSLAIIHDDTYMIRVLLEEGVDIHRHVDKLSPFELACIPEIPISQGNFDALLAHSRVDKINAINESLEMGILHMMADVPFHSDGFWKLGRLLAVGADYNLLTSNVEREPVLGRHLRNSSSPETAKMLLGAGADPWLAAQDGFDAALEAVMTADASMLATIKAVTETQNLTPQWARTVTETWEADGFFLNANALHLAAAHGKIYNIEFYLNEGLLLDLNVIDGNNMTPMHYAAQFGRERIVRFLGKRGCNIDAVAKTGLRPLHIAIKRGHLSIARQLLDMGAEVTPCSAGVTPLAYAHQSENPEMVELLKTHDKHGVANATATGMGTGAYIMGQILHDAILYNDVQACKDIISQGAPVNFEFQSPWHETPLILALYNRVHPAIVVSLIEHGAEVTIVLDSRKKPPFLTALEAAMAVPEYSSVLPLLLEKHENVWETFQHVPRNPIHSAAHHGNEKGLEILLRHIGQECGCGNTTQ